MNVLQFMNIAPDNDNIKNAILTMSLKLDFDGIAVVSVSGGSDSDIMIDIVQKTDKKCKVVYAFSDTGIQYQATKQHLKFLEEKYGIEIVRLKAQKPVPTAVRMYGQPFLSKKISDMISRLQAHEYEFDECSDYDSDAKKYKKCKSALMWIDNAYGENSRFNVSHKKLLREFITTNKPYFNISEKCCKYAKKDALKRFEKQIGAKLKIVGIRRSQGGARSQVYHSCFSEADQKNIASYRPLFHWNDTDKEQYCKCFGVTHSRCYTQYGMRRTGCAGCPFGLKFEEQLQIIEKFQPKLYQAVTRIFGQSYEYTKAYRQFVRRHDDGE